MAEFSNNNKYSCHLIDNRMSGNMKSTVYSRDNWSGFISDCSLKGGTYFLVHPWFPPICIASYAHYVSFIFISILAHM